MTAAKGKLQRQVVLPLGKAVEISFKSLRIRFLRSLITTAGIILGIAFLMAVFSNTLIHRSLLERGTPATRLLLQTEEVEFGARQIWLVSLSLLVCTVGITNAMLMAVTERYKEIGTMKCLGALNSFIVKLFLLESGFQGLFGSLSGALLAVVSMFLVNLIKYGYQVIATFPVFGILKHFVLSLIVGVFLSVIAAIYPAYQAAKMVPAEAMRVEV